MAVPGQSVQYRAKSGEVAMSKKAVKPDDPEQYKRFVEDAERLGCNDPDALDKVLESGVLKTDKDKPSGNGGG